MITLEASYSEFSSLVTIDLFGRLRTGVESSRCYPPPDAKATPTRATQVQRFGVAWRGGIPVAVDSNLQIMRHFRPFLRPAHHWTAKTLDMTTNE